MDTMNSYWCHLGWLDVPATFMCKMNGEFKYFLDKFVIVLLDDIVMYSKKKEEIEKHLRMVLQVLREHQLYAKLSKCNFYKNHIHYLGHIVLEYGITIDPKKI